MVKYLKNIEIDRKKWDRCIETAVFETLYPYSWYLDLVNPGWDALVRGDYEMVMPLTVNRKAGHKLLLQPILAQQLGIFAEIQPLEDDLQGFLSVLLKRFRYIDICLNKSNRVPPNICDLYTRANYELDLRQSGTGYSSNPRRNIQKGRQNSFEFRESGISEYLDLKFRPGENIPVDRGYLENLFRGLAELGKSRIFGLFLNNELQASAVLGYAKTRIIYITGCSSPIGKETRAMFVLMDHLIEHSRGISPVFDFEGSDIPGVARFFEGFGAVCTSYQRLVQKKFPFTLIRS